MAKIIKVIGPTQKPVEPNVVAKDLGAEKIPPNEIPDIVKHSYRKQKYPNQNFQAKMDGKLLTKKAYSLRLKITKGHLKEFEESYRGLRKKYAHNKNQVAVLGRGYLEHIEQFKKEIRFYENMLNVMGKAKGVVRRKWFESPIQSLGNRIPLEVIMNQPAGVNKVLNLIGRIEYGIMD